MTDGEYQEARELIDTADSMYGDLPDGAYWAACEELGASQGLQIEVDEYERRHKLGVHAEKSTYPRNKNNGPFAPF